MERYACITGASSGIGYEMAKILSNKGYNIIAVARRTERLEALQKILPTKTIIYNLDLSKKESCYQLINDIKNYDVEIFINNAGFGLLGEFTKTPLEKELAMIELNIEAVHILSKLILQEFMEKNHGYLLNVSSIAGLMPGGPYMATYYATKAYVESLTLAVAREIKLANKDIYVGSLCPGPVKTEFNNVADCKFNLKGITATACAEIAVKKMFKKKTIIIPAFNTSLGLFATRFVSRKTAVSICGKMQEKKGIENE